MAKVVRNRYSCFSLAHQSVYYRLKEIRQKTAKFSTLEKETLMQKHKNLKESFNKSPILPLKPHTKHFFPSNYKNKLK